MNSRDEQSGCNLEYNSELNYFPPQKFSTSINSAKYLRVGSVLRSWGEVSKINYWVPQHLEIIKSRQSSLRGRSIGLTGKDFFSMFFMSDSDSLFDEQFPHHVTSLLNEGQLWGCFYNFPELYADEYAPMVRIRKPEDIAPLVEGVLTRDMVTTCLSYLKRTPILGDFVYIKLNLSGKHLLNIDILQHYKYLVYLDLSSNLLTDLSVLSYLLYLQFISVAFNRLSTVLEYSTPQWFLTEVHYKYNSVKKIRDLDMFWSITILDLSHNNIKSITGLEKLRYLRHLDLSFNHIQRLENLSHLRLLWLDVSYNNISSFECGPDVGLPTLLHLEFLNLNENNLKSMRLFSGCTRLRELHIRNNRLSILLELAVYMRQLRRLSVLDVRANPVCAAPGYKQLVLDIFPALLSLDATELDPVDQLTVYMRQLRRLSVLDVRANPVCAAPGYKQLVLDIFPALLSLDSTELDPVDQRRYKMESMPDVTTFACRRLLRMLFVEQLARAHVSPHVPPADTTEVPLVVIVGYEAVGKGALARRLASECSSKIRYALQHTTAECRHPECYRAVSRRRFDDMLADGELLTYCELEGESYGLSREEAFITDGKVSVCTMDLVSALMLKLRGRRPYLILATCQNKQSLTAKQKMRKMARHDSLEKRWSVEPPCERSTLQVLLSGRIIITGILNEIIMNFVEDKEKSEFVIASTCSLLLDSEARKAAHEADPGRDLNPLTVITSSTNSLEDEQAKERERSSQIDTSLYSLYKESPGTSDYGHQSYDYTTKKCNQPKKEAEESARFTRRNEKDSNASRPKSYDFCKFTSPDSAKSSKSVTFTSQDNPDVEGQDIQPPLESQKPSSDSRNMPSISTKLNSVPWPSRNRKAHETSPDDFDLWFTFLIETGLLQASDITPSVDMYEVSRHNTKTDDPASIIKHMDYYDKTVTETASTTIRDDYEGIHRLCPGLFHDTVTMDDPNEAFRKTKRIIKNIVNSQSQLRPMFDIDFANLPHYPIVQSRLETIRKQIAPRKLFY